MVFWADYNKIEEYDNVAMVAISGSILQLVFSCQCNENKITLTNTNSLAKTVRDVFF